KCLIKAKEKESSADTSLKCPTCDTSVNLPGSSINQKKLSLKINLLVKKASCVTSIHALMIPRSHKHKQGTVHHELMDTSATKDFQSNDLPKITHQAVNCAQHSNEKLKFYCKNCEKVVCRDCILLDHQGHEYKGYKEECEASCNVLKAKCG
uniref:B box-type domain-containing protein n=1 Tax=Amphimedon queenslandica TaxID=400682 RepID=A0A1X7V8Y4_AMPQE